MKESGATKVSLIPGTDSITQVLSLVMYVFFIGFIFYGQRIQMYIMIREVENSLHKLRHIKEEGKKTAIDVIKELGKPAIRITSYNVCYTKLLRKLNFYCLTKTVYRQVV